MAFHLLPPSATIKRSKERGKSGKKRGNVVGGEMLTDKFIRSLKRQKTVRRYPDNHPDPDLKGFGIMVEPGGAKRFYLGFTSPEVMDNKGRRKRRYAPCGDYPEVGLSEGRERGRESRRLVKSGIDPIEETQRQAEKAKSDADAERRARELEDAFGTTEQLFDCYATDLEIDGKRAAKEVRNIYRRDIHPVIGTMKAREATEDHFSDILTVIVERGAETLAERTRSYSLAAFEFGLTCKKNPRWRKKAPEFGLTHNPLANIRRAKRERPRTRNLSKEELRELWVSVDESKIEVLNILALKLLSATGQRVEEVLHASTHEFSREERLWIIPAERRKVRDKTTEPHLVPFYSS